MIGHKTIVDDLKKLAAKGELAHGYIFFGPSMVGKRSVALAFAKFLEKGVFEKPEEGEVLQDAKLIDLAYMKQLNPDTKGSIGIDAVREVKGFLGQKPNVSARRTLVLDDAELLTTEAQNAVLKITEEPTPSSLLIFITSDIDGLLSTISSRLQKIYFGIVPKQTMETWLTKERGMAKKAADELASRSFGKPGLAVRLMEDKKLAATIKLAGELLALAAERRRDFLKKMLEDEEFNFSYFLDALVLALAARGPKTKNDIARWHKALTLRSREADFSLNPKLQLENLFI